ncbi:MAG: hypothetical protein KF773_35480 [Deltaproteobacteria bacterium]|nr:hypothetical protein [Deltaproteobacteria bacterium]MCW5808312.1 hypothetical protein [Deltaproteobacteria bacterium]
MSKRPGFALIALLVVAALPRAAGAGKVTGKLELPAPPERPPSATRGFLDRVENQIADVQKPAVAPFLLVALESDGAKADNPADVTWEIVGDSFGKPIVGVPVGGNLVIVNATRTPRALSAAEDGKLIDGIVNPNGQKPVKITAAKVYTITAANAPYLRGKIVGVPSTHFAYVDATGKFELDVPDGSYKVRVFYRDGWIERDETVTVPFKGELQLKGPLAPAKK